MPHERRDVVRTLAKRRYRERDDVEPEVQILPERAVGNRAREILVRGREDANIDADRLAATDSLDLARLDRPQKLRLRLGAEVADLVEQQRTTVGQLEASDPTLGRSGERTALVTEHSRSRRGLAGSRRSSRERTDGPCATHRREWRRRRALFPCPIRR